MKEFEPHLLKSEKIEIHQEKNQKQEINFIGKIVINAGLKLFELAKSIICDRESGRVRFEESTN